MKLIKIWLEGLEDPVELTAEEAEAEPVIHRLMHVAQDADRFLPVLLQVKGTTMMFTSNRFILFSFEDAPSGTRLQ